MSYVHTDINDSVRPGDIYIANDPFKGWGHMPDVAIVMPVVIPAGELAGYTMAYSHHTDMGGRFPGSMSSKSSSSFEEGLRLPVIRLARGGEIDRDLLDLILSNVRGPEIWLGDLEAKVAGCHRGAAEFERVVAKHGTTVLDRFTQQMNQLSERAIRSAISQLPDGEYEYADEFEDGGFGKIVPGLPIKLTIRIAGDTAAVDFTGTSDQVESAINLPIAQTTASVYGAFKLLVQPEILMNQGFTAALSVYAPLGSLINPRYPAAVGGRGPLVGRVRSMIQRALAMVVPERIPVPSETADSLHAVGTDSHGRPFVMLDGFFGGWGGRPHKDGIDGLAPMEFGAYGAAPAELVEREYPVLLEEFAYVPDSAGPGKHRGSLAIRRVWRFLSPADVMIRTSRLTPSPGLAGGEPGRPSANHRWRPGKKPEELPEEMHLHLHVEAGDRVEHVLGGFGGWGDPRERDSLLVYDDIINGKLSTSAAETQYGVAVTVNDGGIEIDTAKTKRLRASVRLRSAAIPHGDRQSKGEA
jgi:N-methylhydantoinase B